MAWPQGGRTGGGARREARARLLGGAFAFASVLAGGGLLALSAADPARLEPVRAAALEVTAPLWTALGAPTAAVEGAVDAAGDYVAAAGRVGALERELAAARSALGAAEVARAENARLRALLRFADADRRRIATARIAGGSGASLVESAVISAGSVDGVRRGQAVTSPAGLLGRVTEVSAHAARVLLVSDAESRVPGRLVRTGLPAVVAGVGGGLTELRFVPPDPGRVPRPGDLVVTSGDGGVFAPDIPVARIIRVTGDLIVARPLASPALLGLAVVEAAWLPSPAALAATPGPVRMAGMDNP